MKSDYADYSEWKGWGKSNKPEIEKENWKRFNAQLNKLSIQFTNINALEIGFGSGEFLRFLKSHNSAVEGVEIQEKLIQEAILSGIPAHDSVDKVNHKPYDLIVAFDVLEHMSVIEIKDLFAKLKNILKNDGKLLFKYPNGDSFMGLSSQNGDYTHITFIGRSKLEQLLHPLDLKITKYEGTIEWPKTFIKNRIRVGLQKTIMKLLGFGNEYFFSGDVVVVIERR